MPISAAIMGLVIHAGTSSSLSIKSTISLITANEHTFDSLYGSNRLTLLGQRSSPSTKLTIAICILKTSAVYDVKSSRIFDEAVPKTLYRLL
ncbi:hypothetical protein D3C72_2369120 [compost metagenome]